jgi:hypothetical protein
MSEAIELDAANENENNQVKIRSCLMCRDDFESAWSGERVCKRCKSQAQWITGNSSLAA